MNAQSKFKRFIKSAEGWRKLEFVSSILGMIALVALIVISIFRSQIIQSIILGSAVMDEYKFVNPSTPPASVKAYTLPPAYPDQKLIFNHLPCHKTGETKVQKENRSSLPK